MRETTGAECSTSTSTRQLSFSNFQHSNFPSPKTSYIKIVTEIHSNNKTCTVTGTKENVGRLVVKIERRTLYFFHGENVSLNDANFKTVMKLWLKKKKTKF
ncbi:hypothetical protein Tsp_08872 [Trichinella spiralis]|uniref:hypothetical protein n=1 Tax=Trichinella spiralis TaxID=6334 RepID=UPI0001EFE8A7|nr:hypothetical protein Tsp_08872 [Trichinella spiralis]